MRRLLPALALLVILALACGAPSAVGIAEPGVDGRAADTASSKAVPASNQGSGGSVPVPLAFEGERNLILTASVALRATDPWATSDRAQQIALALGGDVMGLAQSGAGDQRVANLTLRVPAARFNDALRQLRELKDVEVAASSVDGKDVTEQFVDLQARLRAKQAEEQRYLALLARAEKIDDILRIDQALSSVRTQIEQLTCQVNSIKTRTQFSTITVSITPLTPQPIPTDPRAYDPAKTFAVAFAALAALFRVVADAAIWALVFGWLPLLAFAIAAALARARRTLTTPAA